MIYSWLKRLLSRGRERPASPPVREAPLPQKEDAEPKEAPQSASRRPQSAPIIIGLDFGTSSTKVVFRRLGESVAWVVPALVSSNGLAWFCTPADRSVKDGEGHLQTGSSDPQREDGKPLKLQLLDSTVLPEEFGEVERTVVGFLGAVLEHAAGIIRQHYGITDFRPIVNVGVPVAYFGSREEMQARYRKYEDVARAALATSTMAGGPGLRPGLFREETQCILADGVTRADGCRDSVAILPESVAALVSLTREPTVEPGIYSVVDIGAGTTEISTSLFYVSADGRSVSCYQDSTERFGILDFPQAIKWADGERANSLLHRWWRQFEVNWEVSRRKDAASGHAHRAWARTAVMFTGGGGFHPEVRRHFASRIREDSPANGHFQDWGMELRNYQPSEQVIRSARGANSESRDGFHLLAVAHGLSFHRRGEWPEWYRPDDVPFLEKPAKLGLPYDPQEAGYED